MMENKFDSNTMTRPEEPAQPPPNDEELGDPSVLDEMPQKRKGPCCLYFCGFCLMVFLILVSLFAIAMTKGFRAEDGDVEASGYGDASVGYPVWSDDNSGFAGVEVFWSQGIHFPPLQSLFGKVNPRFKVFIQEGGRRTDLVTIKQHAMSLYYMETAGYVLVNYLKQPAEVRATTLVSTTDASTRTNDFLSNEGLGFARGAYQAIPSRDGATIAAVSWQTDYTRAPNLDYFASMYEFRLVMVDAKTMKTIVSPISFQDVLNRELHWQPFCFWDDAGAFRMTDMMDFSRAFYTNGTVNEKAGYSECIPFGTKSGPVRASDGLSLEVDEDAGLIITSSDPDPVKYPYCGFS